MADKQIMQVIVETSKELNEQIIKKLCKNIALQLFNDSKFRQEIGLEE